MGLLICSHNARWQVIKLLGTEEKKRRSWLPFHSLQQIL